LRICKSNCELWTKLQKAPHILHISSPKSVEEGCFWSSISQDS
jgi:hypothetical protein